MDPEEVSSWALQNICDQIAKAEGTTFSSVKYILIERFRMKEIHIALEALKFGGAMIYPLFVLAVLAAVVILDKTFVYWRYVRLPRALVEFVETHDFSWPDFERRLTELNRLNYFLRFFRVVIENRRQPLWWLESRAGDEAYLIEKALSRGLWVLETVVTAAPLLGLLGTITGMMHAFNLIGNNGLVDPTGVTGGVAQALIATAMGLFIAVIALFAFNFFSRRQSQVLDEMERLGTRLVDNIRIAEVFQEVQHETA